MAAPITLLNSVVMVDPASDLPLHAQVRRGLKSIIDERFEDGQKFFTEPELIAHLKVSQSTVRRALADLATEGLLERRVARGSFVKKRSPNDREAAVNTLGVFVPAWESAFLSGMLEQWNVICRERRLRLQVYYTHQGQELSDAYGLLEQPPAEEHVILFANLPRATTELYSALTARGYRTVNVDALIDGYPGAYVGIDQEQVISIGLEHLVALGHRSIGLLVNEPPAHGAVIARVRAFERQARERGLAEARVIDCGMKFWDDSFDVIYNKMPEIWAMKPRPTALFAISDTGAWAALKWLAEQKISVPQEISILGFSDDRPSRFTYPALTTIGQPIGEIARRAVEMLFENGRRPEFILPVLVERESTGKLEPQR